MKRVVLLLVVIALAVMAIAPAASAKHGGGNGPIVTNVNDPGDGGGAYPWYTGSCLYTMQGQQQSYDWNGQQFTRVWKCEDGFWNEYRYDFLYRYWYFTGVRYD